MAIASTISPAAPAPSPLWPWLRCALVLGVHFVMMLILILVSARLVPVFMRLFERENVDLAAVTQQLYSISRFVVSYWYLGLFLGLLVDLPLLVFLTLLGARWRWLLSIYEYAWVLGTLLFLFWAFIAVAMPTERILQLH